jgi:hypothetical protein
MEEEKPPLETLALWYAEQSTEIMARIALTSRRLRGLPVPEHLTPKNLAVVYHAWLGEPLPPPAQAGKAVMACALIDFDMEEFGRAETWEDMLGTQLDLVERVPAGDFKALLNRQLGEHGERRELWMSAAQSWWKLRAMELHSDSIRVWMMEQEEGKHL